MAFRAGAGGVVIRMAILTGSMVVVEAVHPAAGIRVVKSRLPIRGGMALSACRAEHTGVRRRLRVAGRTVRRSAFERVVGVAPGAGHPLMRPGQGERHREPELIVGKMSGIDDGYRSRRAAVVRVADPA